MTLKRPKDKGTRFETWVERQLQEAGLDAARTEAGFGFDVKVRGSTGRTLEVLVARENHGRALATLPFTDLIHILREHGDSANIECKHLARIALHGIYEGKFS